MCFASLYVPTSGNQGDLTAIEKRLVPKFVTKSIDCTGALYVSGKGFSHRQRSDSTSAHTYPPSISRKALRKLRKDSPGLNSEDVEEQKQTLLSTEDVKRRENRSPVIR